ncbi:MAG: sulfite exporter TauE/SafE family protein [Candidatus Marinimicrobia bacterium]|nr:sulfite exporter TauE/SafE family protein [Candidatus Neomarinimicrobiota bacterium]MCF7922878.1 sulfite exporter TauE/SafE family protein [Candidatus Neomarinimicrobiota bacterium]
MLENLSLLNLIAVLLIGACAGFINILAGGGSFLTLPLLIFLGLPPNLANGTNRLAILMQNSFAVGRFMKKKVNPGKFALKAALFAVPGGIIGAWLATLVSNSQFKLSLALVMIVMSLFTLFSSNKQTGDPLDPQSYAGSWLGPGIAYFLVGIYGGYIQAGVGFLVITVLLWQNINLVHGNAVKLTIIFFFTAIALIIFAWNGQVNWGMGFMLGIGNMIGAWLGTHVAIKKGHAFIKHVVTVAVIGFAIKLLIDM